MNDSEMYSALLHKYLQGRSWFDAAIDDRNQVVKERDEWKAVAEGRVRSPFAACLAVACFLLGTLFGISLQWVPR